MEFSNDFVLNALRHHWNLHYNTSFTILCSIKVLNALRHHWNLHAAVNTPIS